MTRQSVKMGIVGLLAAAGLAGCGSAGGSGTSRATAAATGAVHLTGQVAPARGTVSEISWDLPTGEPTTLDPAASSLENVSTVDGNLCESLFRFGANYQLVPNLATKLIQPNPTTYVFDLRSGVRFWDGHPLTAADVVYSMERIENPALASAWIAAFQHVRSITASGPLQVTVKLSQPDALFRWAAATPATNVVEQAYVAANPKAFGSPTRGVMCTGPFKFDSWTQGQDIEIVKNTGYWDRTRMPRVSMVKFLFDTDPSSLSAALSDGSIDGAFDPPVATFKQLRATHGGSLLFGSGLGATFISWFVDRPSVKNADIRAALKDVVPYASIAKSIYGGSAVAVKSLTPPPTWGYASGTFRTAYAQLPEATQDLSAAKQLVAEAPKQTAPIVLGYPSSDPGQADIALAIQSAAAEVGLKVSLDAMNPAQYGQVFTSPQARAPLSGLLAQGYLDFPEPLEYDAFWTTGSFYNFGGYSNPTYDRLIARADRTLDPAQRAQVLTRAEAIYYASNSAVPIVSQYVSLFVNRKLTGVTPVQSFYYTPWADTLGAR